MMAKEEDITILGGGISGITSGIVLQILGYRTQILTKERADRPSDPSNPVFASLFPSASVIPHSVFGTGLAEYVHTSCEIFKLLHQLGYPGMSIHRHFEVFEYEVASPFYAKAVSNFRRIDSDWENIPDVPRLASARNLYGWVFDCLFADWPHYLPRLFEWYERLGGILRRKKVTPKLLEKLETPVVNCTGLEGRTLFDDTSADKVLKGHLVKISGAPDVKGVSGLTISYNYNPSPDTYSDSEGNTQDLYFYPRSDGWFVGGSRLKGTVDAEGGWHGLGSGEPARNISGIEVPAPIIELNAEILLESYGVDFHAFDDREADVGYRYIRDENSGLRLERSPAYGNYVVHNYGHGGAGVTLSWGCAVRIARWLDEDLPVSVTPNISDSTDEVLHEALIRMM